MAANKQVLLAEADQQEWHSVKSSNVGELAYAEDFSRMYVKFKASGKKPASLYVYHDVPKGVFQGFLSAPSKGKYEYYVIRNGGRDDVYPFDQLY